MTNNERQERYKALGLYDGKIDGIRGSKQKAACKKLQDKYFTHEKDKDGVDGKNTDILLETVYNFRDIEHFTPAEIRCRCGHCTGYPAVFDRQLIKNLDYLRDKSGSPMTITSGLRCKLHNKAVGGAINRRHMSGNGADVYYKELTDTRAKRKALIERWKTFKKNRYAYSDSGNMGNAVHLDVR